MVEKKGLITAASTLAIAFGIGFVMQSGDSARTWYGNAPQQAAPQRQQATVLDVQSIQLTAAVDSSPQVDIPASEPVDGLVLASAPMPALDMPDVADAAPLAPECAITVQARTLPGAMVKLELAAPCLANERLTVHHGGMMFTEATSEDGNLTTMVPAMAVDAVFILAFTSGDGAVAQASVPDLDQYDRTILQWRGSPAFSLHAREFGADYGSDGHIWSGGERDLGGIATGESGFILQVGDVNAPEPLLAEIYTFPTGKAVKDGTIDLSVEAEVTAANCGRDIEAQTLERQSDGVIKSQDLVLSVPDCGAVGDFMVLNNLVSDLKVAAIN